MSNPRKISVAEAAIIAHRSTSTIYLWIEQGLLTEYQGEYGEILLDGVAVLVVEETRRRGRPKKVGKSGNAAL